MQCACALILISCCLLRGYLARHSRRLAATYLQKHGKQLLEAAEMRATALVMQLCSPRTVL